MSADAIPTIERVYTKLNLGEEKARDLVFWQSQTYEARLASLEHIRQEHTRWAYGDAESRLQKVYRIVKLSS